MSIRLNGAEQKAMGIETPGTRRRAATVAADPKLKHRLFLAACEAHGLPLPVEEYPFAKDATAKDLPPHMLRHDSDGRAWRFDYLFAEADLALEIQGGLFNGGRHVRGAALLKEYQKINAAVILGYAVLFTTWQEIEDGSIFPTIKAAIAAREDQ